MSVFNVQHSNGLQALILAGGTGGHIYPALAVADELRTRGWSVDWIGTKRGLEARVVPANRFAFYTLPVYGLRGKGLVFRIRSIFYLLLSFVLALFHIVRLKPSVVLGMGGYVSGPAGLAAVILRCPLVIHEQNAVAGTTNRWLKPVADRMLCGLSDAFGASDKSVVVGNPVRKGIAAHHFDSREWPESFNAYRPLRLLVLGGSLGSRPLNKGVPAALHAVFAKGEQASIAVRHQCGEQHLLEAREAYTDVDDVDVLTFIDDMAAAYMWADLVISRAGALTITELAVTGTPSILVPLPHAIDDHQTLNAQVLSSQGAAQLLPQRELTPDRLGKLIKGYLESPNQLRVISDKARAIANPTAAAVIADTLTEVACVP